MASGALAGGRQTGGVAGALLGLSGRRSVALLQGAVATRGSGSGSGWGAGLPLGKMQRGAIENAQLPGMYAVLNRNRRGGIDDTESREGRGTGAFALLSKDAIDAARGAGGGHSMYPSKAVVAIMDRGERGSRARRRRTAESALHSPRRHASHRGVGSNNTGGTVHGIAGETDTEAAAMIAGSGGDAGVALSRLVTAGGALEEKAVQRRIDARGLPRRTPSPEPLLPYTTRKPAPEPNPLPSMEEIRSELEAQGTVAVGKLLRQHRREAANATRGTDTSRGRVQGAAGANGDVRLRLAEGKPVDGEDDDGAMLTSIFGYGEGEEGDVV